MLRGAALRFRVEKAFWMRYILVLYEGDAIVMARSST